MKIKRESVVNLLLLLIGIFCQTNQMMSRGITIVYLGACLLLFIVLVYKRKVELGIGFFWFFLFVILVLLSLVYTVNKINPDYVYTRIITYLILLFFTTSLLKTENNIKILFKGFLIGGLIGITIVLINQHSYIGIRRIGSGIYGSFAVFGSLCASTMISFIFLQKEFKTKTKVLLFIYIALSLLLSGARKALLITIMLPLLMQLFDRRKKISKKFMIFLVLSISALLIVYFSINNEYVYKIIGYRIESGISSIIGEDSEDASLNERGSLKTLAKELFKEKVVFGWGIHGFAYKNFMKNGILVFSHDGFLEILSCYGLIGFIIYYWIFIYIILNYKQLLYDRTGIFLFSYIIVVLLMELYGISFFNCYFILLVGLCANIISKRRKNDKGYTKKMFKNITG